MHLDLRTVRVVGLNRLRLRFNFNFFLSKLRSISGAGHIKKCNPKSISKVFCFRKERTFRVILIAIFGIRQWHTGCRGGGGGVIDSVQYNVD